MVQIEQQQNKLLSPLGDPDPVSIALGFFSAVIGAAGLIIKAREKSKEKRQELARVLSKLSKADRALNRMDLAYRNGLSFYNDENLKAEFAIGVASINGNSERINELNKIRKDILDAGLELEEALDDLSELVDDEVLSAAVLEVSDNLRKTFDRARYSKNMVSFLVAIGIMIDNLGIFIDNVGRHYGFQPTHGRRDAIRGTINQLEQRAKRIGVGVG